VTCSYHCSSHHTLYLGTRLAFSGASVGIRVDGGAEVVRNLQALGEDVLMRLPLGERDGGNHTVSVTHQGPAGSYFYFDFLEAAIPVTGLPAPEAAAGITLATDWDTDHSIAVAPERTAWMIHSLGFHGRANPISGPCGYTNWRRACVRLRCGRLRGDSEFSQITGVIIGRTDYLPRLKQCCRPEPGRRHRRAWRRLNSRSPVTPFRRKGKAPNPHLFASMGRMETRSL
jgi:hypothetical protein